MKQHSQENAKQKSFELSDIRDKAKDHNLKSITNLAIHGPISVEEKLRISSDDSFSMCQKICQKLEGNQMVHPKLLYSRILCQG